MKSNTIISLSPIIYISIASFSGLFMIKIFISLNRFFTIMIYSLISCEINILKKS